MAEREVYLKPEYDSWYPAIPAEKWIGAYTAQYLVGFQLKYGEPRWECTGRLLSPEHFLFRGGESSSPRSGERRSAPKLTRGRVSGEETARNE
jgi:hypothetical protein